MTERLPRRFRYKVDGNDRWLYGCFVPAEHEDRGEWIVLYANGTAYRPRHLPPGIQDSGFDAAEWIDTDHDWPGDRMPEETCVWQKQESLFAPSCAETFHVEMCAFCPSCGKRTELTK